MSATTHQCFGCISRLSCELGIQGVDHFGWMKTNRVNVTQINHSELMYVFWLLIPKSKLHPWLRLIWVSDVIMENKLLFKHSKWSLIMQICRGIFAPGTPVLKTALVCPSASVQSHVGLVTQFVTGCSMTSLEPPWLTDDNPLTWPAATANNVLDGHPFYSLLNVYFQKQQSIYGELVHMWLPSCSQFIPVSHKACSNLIMCPNAHLGWVNILFPSYTCETQAQLRYNQVSIYLKK